jgi:hypothetical protein
MRQSAPIELIKKLEAFGGGTTRRQSAEADFGVMLGKRHGWTILPSACSR